MELGELWISLLEVVVELGRICISGGFSRGGDASSNRAEENMDELEYFRPNTDV